MILNLRDLAIADAKVTMLKSRCDYLRRRIANPKEAAFARAEVERLEMRINELIGQLHSYRKLTNKPSHIDKFQAAPRMSVQDLAIQLIKRRLMAELSQAELAKAVGTSRQMIARYERTRYASVTLKRIIKIDAILRLLETGASTFTEPSITRAGKQDHGLAIDLQSLSDLQK